MLTEMNHVRQIKGDYFRRTFTHTTMDLVVWYRQDKTIYGFQIAYDQGRQERALTWREDRGFHHARVDDGEDNPLSNRSPIPIEDADFNAARLLLAFDLVSQNLPRRERNLVQRKLQECSKKKGIRPWAYPLLALSWGFIVGIGCFISMAMVEQSRREQPTR